MNADQPGRRRFRISARLRLTLSYVLFLLAAGMTTLLGVYVVMRYVPNYPLTAANPYDDPAVASREEILNAVIGSSGLILGALAIIGAIGGWMLAGWILRPLERINEAARIASTGRLDHRIALSGRHDEFRELADSFDSMLERLHDAFTTQERFAANASHELRTPLAVTAMMLEVAQRNPEEQDYAQLLERLRLTNARSIALTNSLLRLADTTAITAAAVRLDLADIAASVISHTAEEAESGGVIVRAEFHTAPTVGDGDLLTQLTMNLVQNAIRHNVRGGFLTITTTTDERGSRARLRVENSGAIYTHATVERLREPFLRGGGRVTGDAAERGYGLGLSLVARIASAHHGELLLAPRPEGGLLAEVRLTSHGGS